MARKRNVIFILSDDHGQWAAGCYGNPDVKTPHIDELAAEGVLFENFFCTSPVCSPARASILTGAIPSQHGVHDWLAKGCVVQKDYEGKTVSRKRHVASLGEGAAEDYRSIPAEERVPVEETSQYRFLAHQGEDTIEYLAGRRGYTDELADAGYRCGLFGKWHLGDSRNPQKGFEKWSVIGKGGCIYHLPDLYREDGGLTIEDRYVTDLITDEGIEFMEACLEQDKPFYLGLHYTAPHSPWVKEDQPEEIWNAYDECSFGHIEEEPLHPDLVKKRHPQCETPEGRRYMLQGYYTAVSAMDRAIGRLVQRLETLGIREDTLIVFTSDNGMNMGQHGIWGKGNGTFPMNMYDSSVKVPMIVSRPGHVPAGERSEAMLSHYDFLPTLLDYLDVPCSIDLDSLPGRSFASLLRGEEARREAPREEDVVIFDEYGPVRMIRSREWKYIHRYPYGPHELYDLKADPGEKRNLAADPAHAERLGTMRFRLENWFNRYVLPGNDGARLPVTGDGQGGRPTHREDGFPLFKGSYSLKRKTEA